tara:strand:- start:303 stop:851 length:549 start_codon:yes stop_codon:yes gene_type:complete
MAELHGNIFVDLADLDSFKVTIMDVYAKGVERAGFKLKFDEFKLDYVHRVWLEDLERLQEQVNGPPCAFKRAGFLAFWLRRECPVTIWDDSAQQPDKMSKADLYGAAFLRMYGAEWLAFKLGYEICLHVESSIEGGQYDAGSLDNLTTAYIDDMVEFLKRKSVSPHAMYLIYKSLFLRRKKY